MKKTRCLALILAAAVVFVLAACANNSNNQLSETMVFTEEPRSTADQAGGKAEPAEPNSEYIQNLVANMSLEEKVGQMFFFFFFYENAAEVAQKYHLGGYVLFGKDIENKTSDELKNDIKGFQDPQKIKMLIATDEEGGTVVRVSSNPNISDEPFKSPKELNKNGGMDAVIKAESDKADLLLSLGINVNFGPVCDITKDENAFMYDRSFSDDKDEVSKFVASTVEVYKNKQLGSVLKHYPGYGDNDDTHIGGAVDSRSYTEFSNNDFIPFEAGIKAGADAIMVSHNCVSALDEDNPNTPASLSDKAHQKIRDDLNFKGVVITDDLTMDAIKEFAGDQDPAVLAVKAGNDMVCCSDLDSGYNAVIKAVNNGEINTAQIDQSVNRILEWKQRLGILGF